MANKKESNRVTIANLVSIFGVGFMFVFTALGLLMKWELGIALVLSVLITAIAAFLLVMLIKAKGAENDLAKWKIAEYVLLAAYFAFAVPVTFFCGTMDFFVSFENKDDLKKAAEADLEDIGNLYVGYYAYEEDILDRSINGMRNAVRDDNISEDLCNYFNSNGITASQDGLDIKEENLKRKLIKNIKDYEDNNNSKIGEIRNDIDNWNVLSVPFISKRIEDLAEEVGNKLKTRSESERLPRVIDGDIQGYYEFYSAGSFSSKFSHNVKNGGGFSFWGFIIAILSHALILFNYVVAYRTRVVAPHGKDDGGIILKPY